MCKLPLFVITVDTEADDAWRFPDKINLKNIEQIPKFQNLCHKYGIIPTYLITYECAYREESISKLKPIVDNRLCEIGSHLHTWTTPPFSFANRGDVDLEWIHSYQFELPDELLYDKINYLDDQIEKAFQIKPTAHRAGRWGIDQRSIDCLISKKYIVDTSVVPLMPASRHIGKFIKRKSFYSQGYRPFPWYYGGIKSNNPYLLYEVPVTVFIPETLFHKLLVKLLRTKYFSSIIIDNLYRKAIGCAGVLRPDPFYQDDAIRKIFANAIKNKVPVINMMIHSSELCINCSPFSQSQSSLTRVWDNIEDVFIMARDYGLESHSLSAAAKKLFKITDFSNNSN